MKLTLKIKLLPSEKQAGWLRDTINEANKTCNSISDVAWDNKVFNQFKIHHLCYHAIKPISKLSSQVLVRCISKVCDSYKTDKKVKRVFKPFGSITYDSRILTYKSDNTLSIWCIGGRQSINYVCHNIKYLPYIKGEADLIYKNGKFYIFQTVEIPEDEIKNVEDFIGVDFGLTDIAVTSDGVKHSADWINQYREKQQKVRGYIQSKGTRSARQ